MRREGKENVGTDQPSPEIGPRSWHLEWLWTLSLTNEKRKHQNIVLQQQIRNLHKEKAAGGGRGSGPEHRSRAAWFSSRSFRVWTHLLSTAPFQSDFKIGRSRPPSWAVGICEPHAGHRLGVTQAGSQPLRRGSGRTRNAQSTQRGGKGGDSGHRCPTPLTSSCFLCVLFGWR